MIRALTRNVKQLLKKIHLKPLTLAEKCRLQFGAAILFCLALALWIPYFWMGKLLEKNALDSGRAIAETVFARHFQINLQKEETLPVLNDSGVQQTDLPLPVQWFAMKDEVSPDLSDFSERHRRQLERLLEEDSQQDVAWVQRDTTPAANHYLRLVRAQENCLRCHNPQGSAAPFNKNQKVGLIVVRTSARELARTGLMNGLWTILAGLLAAIGAMIAFYTITQRVILRPIRQLRGLANNIAEGNLEVRSAIKTGDEYERLSDAFNHMLDNLIDSQRKLEQANRQLDAKIAQLSEKNVELFRANKLKSEFLANMSHEFRTPLNAILGFAQLLFEKPAADPDKSKRWAENIISSGRSLLNMINDLLDLAKAEAGKMVLRVEKTSIPQLCEGLVAFFSPLTEQKRLKVKLNIDEKIPLVRTDAGKVQQILYNLLSNAVKFTPQDGRIQISASMQDDTTVRITVSDTGPGITEADQQHIFEKFRQLDGSITRSETGTGLGLAICKQLAELLAGSIHLESEYGHGATFYLDIPVNLPEPTAPAADSE